jgi:hypothetical protein
MADRVSELAAVIGMHYHEAGQVEPAVRYLGTAAELALDRYAIDEADQLYGTAYRMLVDTATRPSAAPTSARCSCGGCSSTTTGAPGVRPPICSSSTTARSPPATTPVCSAWRSPGAGSPLRSRGPRSPTRSNCSTGRSRSVQRADDAEVLAHAHTWRIWAASSAATTPVRSPMGSGSTRCSIGSTTDGTRRSSRRGAVGLAQIGLGRFHAARETATWLIDTGASTGARARPPWASRCSASLRRSPTTRSGGCSRALCCRRCDRPDLSRLRTADGRARPRRRRTRSMKREPCTPICSHPARHSASTGSCSPHRRLTQIIRVLDGDLTGGMQQLDAAIVGADRAGSQFLASLGRVYRAGVRSRSVTREVVVPLRVVLRNPGFVARHALPARRCSRRPGAPDHRARPAGRSGTAVAGARPTARARPRSAPSTASTSVRPGRFTAIMGPSGSGKSTLMHCLAGLDDAHLGQVFIGEIDLSALKRESQAHPAASRPQVGFIFQAFNLVPTLTALENITLPMALAGASPTGVARPGHLDGRPR